MRTVMEIEAAIENPPSTELGELLAWIDDHRTMITSSETLFAMYDEEERSNAER